MDAQTARTNMVESQVRTNKVTDQAVIDALLAVPRERFVPPALRGIAYVDEDLPLGQGRHLIEPMVLARLFQGAAVQPGERVLDIACATGYSSAIAARLAARVIGVESVAVHARRARELMAELKIANVEIVEHALAEGALGLAPFDVILVNGALTEIPMSLKTQLADGGRLVAVIKRSVGLGQATLTVRLGEVWSSRILFDAATPLLPEFEPKESFVF
jgi:protein-L-isoaspartate(D-aspartate) O-methyltransferase